MYKKIDRNQPEIVKCLRKMGASVQILSSVGKGCPDLLVGYHGKNYLFEVKDGSKSLSQKRLTKDEELFFDSWKGQVAILQSLDEIVNFINYI